MSKILYHGTSLEKALSILHQKVLVGNKRYIHQEIPMYSLTNNVPSAMDFGDMILCFKNIDANLLEVQYENKKWIRNNRDILEYMYGGSFEEIQKEIEDYSLIHEQEFVGKGNLSFNDEQVSVSIQTYSKSDGDAAMLELKREFPNLSVELNVLEHRKSFLDDEFKEDFAKKMDDIMKLIEEVSLG